MLYQMWQDIFETELHLDLWKNELYKNWDSLWEVICYCICHLYGVKYLKCVDNKYPTTPFQC